MIRGLVHIYCGDGKGKTTAATGLAVRANESGLKVLFLQFLKGTLSYEVPALLKLGITVKKTDEVKKFIPYMTEQEKAVCKKAQNELFETAKSALEGKQYDVIVLDEILGAIEMSMIDEENIISFIINKPANIELVLTGRIASEKLTRLSDYVSQINSIKHPYDKGIKARKGIDY
jgi:cob(I)alamin adenosyltransferase